jgi:hypothetical protein
MSKRIEDWLVDTTLGNFVVIGIFPVIGGTLVALVLSFILASIF